MSIKTRAKGLGRMIREFNRQLRQVRLTRASFNRAYSVIDDKKVIYVVNPKAACSSIKASVMDMGTMSSYHEVHKVARQSENTVNDIKASDYPGYFRFTFVRNPFARLVSCYENMYHTNKGHYNYYLLGYLRKDRGFKGFVNRVLKIPLPLAEKHFCPQYYILQDPETGEPQASFIGHFERLHDDYEPIREKYGFEPLAHYNKTNASRNWMDYYDLDLAKLVHDHYIKDIEMYGYEDAYQALVDYLKAKSAK